MRVNIGPYGEDERVVEIEYHNYDTWNLDHTLALIIVPGLKQLRDTNHGIQIVDMDDLPEDMRWDRPSSYDYSDDDFDKSEAAWIWVQNEMIFAFEEIIKDETTNCDNDRINNGLRLFGKYFRGLWD